MTDAPETFWTLSRGKLLGYELSMETKLATTTLMACFALAAIAGCHHHHDDDDHRDVDARDTVVVDADHHEHHGYYDEHHDWHGGYYDEQHQYHEDPHDWHGDH